MLVVAVVVAEREFAKIRPLFAEIACPLSPGCCGARSQLYLWHIITFQLVRSAEIQDRYGKSRFFELLKTSETTGRPGPPYHRCLQRCVVVVVVVVATTTERFFVVADNGMLSLSLTD